MTRKARFDRRPRRAFAPGPAVEDASALLAWLEANPNIYLRLPVVVLLSPDGLPGTRLAFIGTDAAPPPEDAIMLALDDSTLGIDLSTRLAAVCGAEAEACVVWIEATWGHAIPVPGTAAPPPWPVTVHDVGPPVEGSPATVFAEERTGDDRSARRRGQTPPSAT